MNPPAISGLGKTRLLQMASQAFPIGGYSHSQGLEAAIESGLVSDEASVQQWICDVLEFSLGPYELPCLEDMSHAWAAHDMPGLTDCNEEFLASRESAELRGATVQMGFSMRALLGSLPGLPRSLLEPLRVMVEPSLPCVWSGLALAWTVPMTDSIMAYAWAWAENQVLVAMKSVPIGQSAGQRVLWRVGAEIETVVRDRDAAALDASAVLRSNFAPGFAILSSQHETQYSRLFRS
jgi:urease accessory protein